MNGLNAVFKREFAAYFATPLAYIFIAVFVAVSVLFAVHLGQIIELNKADLQSFFQFHPFLYVVFIPALGMKIWSEDFKTGTYEILFSLPVSNITLIIGKYFAGLAVIGLTLLFCVPLWVAINILGNVDNGVVAAGFLGSFLMAAAFLAVTLAISAVSNSQIVVFVLSCFVCFVFVAMGMPVVLNSITLLFGEGARGFATIFSIADYFDLFSRGFIPLNGIIFFISFIAFWLGLGLVVILGKRGGLK